MTIASRIFAPAAVAVILACIWPGGPAESAGSGGSGSAGETSSAGPSDDYLRAERMVRVGAYREAIDLFEAMLRDDPENPDVLNYLGYSHRKLGEIDAALAYYRAALESDPDHVGANEYLGELYLEMGDLGSAEERLSVLQRACSGCEEQDELAEKIAAFKAD